jgi:hypothetical protein
VSSLPTPSVLLRGVVVSSCRRGLRGSKISCDSERSLFRARGVESPLRPRGLVYSHRRTLDRPLSKTALAPQFGQSLEGDRQSSNRWPLPTVFAASSCRLVCPFITLGSSTGPKPGKDTSIKAGISTALLVSFPCPTRSQSPRRTQSVATVQY